jgi:hypothetical protein
MNRSKPSFRTSVAAFAIAATSLTAGPALAEKASLKEFSFSVQPAAPALHVISTDKQTWNAFKTGATAFSAHMKVDTKYPGAVLEVAVALGECAGGGLGCGTALWNDAFSKRDYEATEVVTLPAASIPVSGTGILLGDHIIARCNEKLQADGPTKSHSFTHELPVTLVVDTEKVWGNIDNSPVEANSTWPEFPNDNDHHKTDTLEVQIVCDAVVKPSADDLAFNHGEFDVENVKLFLTTYQQAIPGSNPATVCPGFKMTSRAETNQAGHVAMKIWRQKDAGPITSKVVDVWSSYDASKNGYFAYYHEFIDVGTTSWFQFKVEVTNEGPWGPQDGWKDITVHCTNPGGGGFAPAPNDNNDGLFPSPQASWAGELTIADSAGHDKSCPRSGQVFFEVTRQAPGDFDYRISCNNGAYFEGTATGYNQGSGVFEAFGAHDLNITRTRDIQCTLQEMTPAPVTVAVKKEGFTCANPTFPPATTDLQIEPRPIPDKPAKPLTVVVPLADPTHDCAANQKLVRGQCVDKPDVSILCKKGYELKGKTCVKKPAIFAACKSTEKRVGDKCVGVSIHCLKGFEQVGLKCVRKPVVVAKCDTDEHRVNGKCVKKPVVSIFCKKGYKAVGKSCVKIPSIAKACAKTEKLVRGTCVPKEPVAKVFTKTLKAKNKPAKRALKPAKTLKLKLK